MNDDRTEAPGSVDFWRSAAGRATAERDKAWGEVERLRASETELCAQIVRLQDEAEDVHVDVERLRGRVVTDGANDRLRVIEIVVPMGYEAVVRPAARGERS